MRKSLALILGAMMALSLAPMTSHASSQCPGAVKDDPNAAGVTVGYKILPIVRISSGPMGLPDNAVNETGLVNLGDQVGCNSTAGQLTDGTVNTNWLTPGAQQLMVSAYNYPTDVDHYPPPGCMKYNGTPSTTCTASGDIKLTWKINNQPTTPCFCFRSAYFNIPGAPQSTLPGGTLTVTACVVLKADHATTASRFCRTYKDVNQP
jgi:hypothetical protein